MEIREILNIFAESFANHEEEGWWGHDTQLGHLEEEFAQAESEILKSYIKRSEVLEMIEGLPRYIADFEDNCAMLTEVEDGLTCGQEPVVKLSDLSERIK